MGKPAEVSFLIFLIPGKLAVQNDFQHEFAADISQ